MEQQVLQHGHHNGLDGSPRHAKHLKNLSGLCHLQQQHQTRGGYCDIMSIGEYLLSALEWRLWMSCSWQER